MGVEQRRWGRHVAVSAGLRGLVVGVVVVLGACSSARGPAVVEATDSTTATTVAGGEWSDVPVTISVTGLPALLELGTPTISAITRAGDEFVAVGQYGAGLTIFRSADFSTFTPTFHEDCCQRSIPNPIVTEFANRLMVGGYGESVGTDGTRRPRSYLLSSSDHGTTWDDVDDPLFSATYQRLDGLVVAGDTVIADVVTDPPDHHIDHEAAWSTDLTTWNRIELPGHTDDDWPVFYNDGANVWATARRDTAPEQWAIWASTDGGQTFEPQAALAGEANSFTAIGTVLVAWTGPRQDGTTDADAQGIRRLTMGGTWEQSAPATGLWGDGYVRFGPSTSDQQTGRTYGYVARTSHASAQYCYTDPDTCGLVQTVLVSTDDAVHWSQVHTDSLPSVATGGGVLSSSNGEIVVWGVNPATRMLTAKRWTGPGTPPTFEPADYPPPARPVALYDGGPLPVGTQARYPLGLGGCGAMYIDGIAWATDTVFPDPIPPSWPLKQVEIADGPSGYLFGQVDRTAQDTIEFSIQGAGAVAAFHPATVPGAPCG